MFVKTPGGKEDDGDVTDGRILLQLTAELQTVHDRHHDVRDDQIGHYPTCQLQPALPVDRLAHLIHRGECRTEVSADVAVVINYEYFRLVGLIGLDEVVDMSCLVGHVRVFFHIDEGSGRLPETLHTYLSGLTERHTDCKRAAFSLLALHRHFAVVQAGKRLYQCQTDACSMSGIAGLIKPVEDIRQVVLCNAAAIVAHHNLHFVSLHGSSKADAASFGRVLHGIAEQIIADTFQLVAVGTHG